MIGVLPVFHPSNPNLLGRLRETSPLVKWIIAIQPQTPIPSSDEIPCWNFYAGAIAR